MQTRSEESIQTVVTWLGRESRENRVHHPRTGVNVGVCLSVASESVASISAGSTIGGGIFVPQCSLWVKYLIYESQT